MTAFLVCNVIVQFLCIIPVIVFCTLSQFQNEAKHIMCKTSSKTVLYHWGLIYKIIRICVISFQVFPRFKNLIFIFVFFQFMLGKSLLLCAILYFFWKPFLHMTAECFAHLSYSLGVHLSMCLSHSGSVSKQCALESQNIHSRLRAVSRTLVFGEKILCPSVWGFPRTRALNSPPQKVRFLPLLACLTWKWLQIGTDITAYHNKH